MTKNAGLNTGKHILFDFLVDNSHEGIKLATDAINSLSSPLQLAAVGIVYETASNYQQIHLVAFMPEAVSGKENADLLVCLHSAGKYLFGASNIDGHRMVGHQAGIDTDSDAFRKMAILATKWPGENCFAVNTAADFKSIYIGKEHQFMQVRIGMGMPTMATLIKMGHGVMAMAVSARDIFVVAPSKILVEENNVWANIGSAPKHLMKNLSRELAAGTGKYLVPTADGGTMLLVVSSTKATMKPIDVPDMASAKRHFAGLLGDGSKSVYVEGTPVPNEVMVRIVPTPVNIASELKGHHGSRSV